MRIAIFGGSGRVGRRLLEYATRSGHTVQALVRDPSRVRGGTGIRPLEGDVTDPQAVFGAVEGAEAVLSALGGAGLAQPGTAISAGLQNIAAAMRHHGVNRVLAVAGSGILDAPGGGIRADDPEFPAIYQPITREHRGTWEALRASGLNWTLVCCPDLLDGELTGRCRVSADRLPEGGSSISVEDVADFMVKQLDRSAFVRRRVGLAY